jgi:hypothetical protein
VAEAVATEEGVELLGEFNSTAQLAID